jgi:site-specific DNA-methyltransferase (cytosine-N4-specific)
VTKKSEIPFGAQFSPNQVDLPRLLQIIQDNAGNRNGITEAIRDEFFADHPPAQRWKLADNTVLALRAYELLEADGATPTALAKDLLAIAHTPEVYERFARHILVNVKGITFVETLMIMQTAGEEINLHTLGKRLEQRGVHVPRGAVHLSSMRLWLAQAGIFDASISGGSRLYEVNQTRLKQLLGIGLDAIDSLTQLNTAQRAFLRALTRIAEPDPLVANKVADLASALYAVEYNHKELPKSILFPLRDLGYIETTKSTAGRGAKPYEVSRTPKFRQEISEPILTVAAEKAGLVPKELFEQPLSQILNDLKSPSKHVKGKALELLAIYLTRLIDLDFKGWRTRSADTGGAEVDAVVEGARLIFSRWQIQAKNTASVRLEDVAKEVGLALTFIYSNVVTMVTTGDFTRDAHNYAQHVMKTCNLNVILLNGSELKRISQDPTDIVAILNSKAEQVMKLKERTDYFVAQ